MRKAILAALARRVLGDEHPDTLTAASNLAVTLGEQGDLTRARRASGDEHPDTLTR